ncbi:MAG: S8 family serine peptidase, partial [Candidatus Glassbacteria bacterium]
MPRRFTTLAGALFLVLLFTTQTVAGVLDVRLEKRLQLMKPGEEITVIVMMKEQADIEAIDILMKAEKASRQLRHKMVVEELRDVALSTQSSILNYLYQKKNEGKVTGYTPHWIANLVVVLTGKEIIAELAQRDDVDIIYENPTVSLIEPVDVRPTVGDVTSGITPGVTAIKADSVWSELGVTGAGTLVANLDTGVDGNHPALADRWRGTEPGVDPSEAWLDLIGGSPNFPTDTYGHGTHVMGTITGLGASTGDTIGVAPGALWIACNAINQSTGPEFDSDVVAAYEWFADPDGNPDTVDDVPDVVQNSWGITEWFYSDPPYTDCDDRWWEVLDNCEAAGVVITWSAGNEGPSAESLRSPADRATTDYNSYSVGAVDATNYGYPYPIASWSSRGPTGCDHVTIKPEVCAPGVDVYSSYPGGSYTYMSGTSMAGPHVAGVIALMREIDPNLPVDEAKDILMRTAHDFGDTGEDNTYGMGFIDALAACNEVGRDEIRGLVRNSTTGNPIDS